MDRGGLFLLSHLSSTVNTVIENAAGGNRQISKRDLQAKSDKDLQIAGV